MEVIYSKSNEEPKELSKENTLDALVYILACWGSFGLVWLLRIIITTGIKKAFKNGA